VDDTGRAVVKKDNVISEVLPGSIAEELEIEAGDRVLEVNGQEPEDIFDYDYLCEDAYIELLVRKADGEDYLYEIEKDEDEDLGIRFENGLMDSYRSCHNKCIFCFIDQMPPGMRDTLYFKDDDARLSFLQGNYITLTNLREKDIDRMIRYRMEPINISIHTMNPELRCRMLNNRFAGDALSKLKRFYDAGLEMNGQIVMCPGYNDGAELDSTIEALFAFLPFMRSLSVVPVGLTKYREGLVKLTPVTPLIAKDTVRRIEAWQKKAFELYGTHFVHASDELYIQAGLDLPEAERYDGYLQLANGVGSLRSMEDEYIGAMEEYTSSRAGDGVKYDTEETLTVATGVLAAPFIRRLAGMCQAHFPAKRIEVVPIVNYFFGEQITVAGLVTGGDLIEQLKGMELGDRLLIPDTMLRNGEEVFLDDVRLDDVRDTLHVPVNIVESNGGSLLAAFLGCTRKREESFPGYEPEEIYYG
jgi:putative radical SAM enzyme (TIGR03279 family)